MNKKQRRLACVKLCGMIEMLDKISLDRYEIQHDEKRHKWRIAFVGKLWPEALRDKSVQLNECTGITLGEMKYELQRINADITEMSNAH